jgi:hypothetical protein
LRVAAPEGGRVSLLVTAYAVSLSFGLAVCLWVDR